VDTIGMIIDKLGDIIAFGICIMLSAAVLGLVSFIVYTTVHNTYCKLFHKCSPYAEWVLNPFNIGGGHYKYYIICDTCGRKLGQITKTEYDAKRDKQRSE